MNSDLAPATSCYAWSVMNASSNLVVFDKPQKSRLAQAKVLMEDGHDEWKS